jgi:tetratricopeptide (TPR) repeat protein
MARKPVVRPSRLSRFRLPEVWAGALLFCMTLVAYLPAIRGGVLWDDDHHLTSPDLQSLHGLWRIWFELGATQQYYPLLHSAFWLEHRFWGDAVLGYHLTNLTLHFLSACLLVTILIHLRVRGAWLAGFLFALHPVCVEAVAWISEQKSTLSAVFYLASALCYLHFDRDRRLRQYFLASALFVLAILSKTITATLPAGILVVLWWQRGRVEWKRDVMPLLPWFGLGAAAGVMTTYVESNVIGARGPEFALTFGQRCLLAGRATWFYTGKLVWPSDLTFFYPRWTLDTEAWWQYLFTAAALAMLAVLTWLAARRHWRGPLAGYLFFVGTLFPALGFFNVYPFLYSYVADHFQYLASVGIIVPAAFGLTVAAERASISHGRALLLAGALVGILMLLTWRQSHVYQDARTLYQETLARNPECWLAHNNLGAELLEAHGRLPDAISHFEAALRLQPNYPQTYNNLGLALSSLPGRVAEAVPYFEAAVRIQPDYAQAQNNLGLALSKLPGRLPDAIEHFESALRTKPGYAEAHNNLGSALSATPGRLADAISEYRAALRIRPDYAEAHYNLGNALADTPGRLAEAISQYQEALGLQPENPQAHNNLGIALAMTPGRLEEAVVEYQAAIRLWPDFVDAHYNLALALSKSGQTSGAISEGEAALRINPHFEPARRMLERFKTTRP